VYKRQILSYIDKYGFKVCNIAYIGWKRVYAERVIASIWYNSFVRVFQSIEV